MLKHCSPQDIVPLNGFSREQREHSWYHFATSVHAVEAVQLKC